MKHKHPWEQKRKALARELKRFPQLAGTLIVSQTQENFRLEGFYVKNTWPARAKNSPKNEGRALLVDDGDLKRSYRFKIKRRDIVVYSTLPYSKIHNEGGKIRKRKSKKKKRGSKTKKSNKSKYTTMPQRQHLGSHPKLRRKVNSLFSRRVINTLTR